MKTFFTLFLVSILISAQNQNLPVIPKTADAKHQNQSFTFSKQTPIFTTNSNALSEISSFNYFMQTYYGFQLPVTQNKPEVPNIEIIFSNDFKAEAYQMEMNSQSIKIKGQKSGIFYGLISLLQMLPTEIKETHPIPCYNINDYPRFKWRGMHLDVSRHFFPKENIFRYLDILAYYKMNTFHWHLTDDQGWRIEIKKHPLLTSKGGWRNGTLISHASSPTELYDSIYYGGFYTQEEVKEVVAYAKARHITVVPEIEMPGHAVAAIHAYPYLSCHGKEVSVIQKWGVFDDVFCTKDTVFSFLEDVLTEVMDLFPSEYIHVGGDECPKINWKNCPVCQERIKSENLKNEFELQSYFIKRIEVFLSKHNRKLIGWDEILEGGLAPNAAVMSWQGIEGGIAATKHGNNAVMTPGSHCYFDHYQGDPSNEPLAIGGFTPLSKVYSYEPIPEALTAEEGTLILGAQANLWTEYIETWKHVEYMLLPRLCALSEVAWSPKGQKEYESFLIRLKDHFQKFDKRDIHYAKSIYEINTEIINDTINHQILLKLNQAYPENKIYYKSEFENSKETFIPYTRPILIHKNQTIKAETRDDKGNVMGKAEQSFFVSKSTGAKIQLKHQPAKSYSHGSPHTLTDGILGRIPWNGKEWLGFQSHPLIATIDLGKTQNIEKIIAHTLKAEASWIHLPSKMKIDVSMDGKKFKKAGELSASDITKSGRILEFNKSIKNVRYVRISFDSIGKIPAGKSGAGHNAWVFVSEIQIF